MAEIVLRAIGQSSSQLARANHAINTKTTRESFHLNYALVHNHRIALDCAILTNMRITIAIVFATLALILNMPMGSTITGSDHFLKIEIDHINKQNILLEKRNSRKTKQHNKLFEFE